MPPSAYRRRTFQSPVPATCFSPPAAAPLLEAQIGGLDPCPKACSIHRAMLLCVSPQVSFPSTRNLLLTASEGTLAGGTDWGTEPCSMRVYTSDAAASFTFDYTAPEAVAAAADTGAAGSESTGRVVELLVTSAAGTSAPFQQASLSLPLVAADACAAAAAAAPAPAAPASEQQQDEGEQYAPSIFATPGAPPGDA